jgi:DNA-binding HxlR family transcriptional regulator
MFVLGVRAVNQDCTEYIRRVSKVTELVHGKWTLQILCAMRYEPVRLSQLQRLIPSASKKALRASLRFLESMHVVLRRDMSDVAPHVEYDFAGDMREVVSSLLDRLAACGDVLETKKAILPK